MSDPQAELDGFLARFTPEVAAQGRAALAALRQRFPTASRLVYDNYNALAIGFCPNDRASNVIVSIALYPRWVSLFFMQAAGLDDLDALLRGGGAVARHIVLKDPAPDLASRPIRALLDQAALKAKLPFPTEGDGPLIIKSVSAKQRPRRPPDP